MTSNSRTAPAYILCKTRYIYPMIRPYIKDDKEKVLDLLRLNTPRYFHAAEEPDLLAYLDNSADHYFVVEKAGEIIGSGGFNLFPEQKTARISWDIIHPAHHGQGIGKQLTLYRLNEIRNNYEVGLITVRTTQLAYRFYEKLGFGLARTEKDFWAKGFDLYQMHLPLTATTPG